jgi:hypothetical protein
MVSSEWVNGEWGAKYNFVSQSRLVKMLSAAVFNCDFASLRESFVFALR